MLFPENPEKRPELWESMEKQLAHEAMCYVVIDGIGYPDASATLGINVSAENLVQRMKSAMICRISASHGKPIAPHFAANLEGATASITEFVTYPSEGTQTVNVGQLRHDLEAAVINLLFGSGEINRVFVPLDINPWDMRDAEVHSTSEGLMFNKRV
jgi:hypothetical protein